MAVKDQLEGVDAEDRLLRVVEERDRARALAAHLEEVVAMRNNVLEALVSGHQRGDSRPFLLGIIEWAEAQLSEVP
jgi:hypothetical protein